MLNPRIEYHRSLYRYLEIERGRGVARLARALRMGRGGLLILGLLIAFPFSSHAQRRYPDLCALGGRGGGFPGLHVRSAGAGMWLGRR